MPIQKTKIAEFDIRKEVEKAHQEIMSHPANISDPVKVEKLNLLLNNLDKSLIKIRKYKNNTIEKMLLFKTLSTFEKKMEALGIVKSTQTIGSGNITMTKLLAKIISRDFCDIAKREIFEGYTDKQKESADLCYKSVVSFIKEEIDLPTLKQKIQIIPIEIRTQLISDVYSFYFKKYNNVLAVYLRSEHSKDIEGEILNNANVQLSSKVSFLEMLIM